MPQPVLAVLAFITRSTVDVIRGSIRFGRWVRWYLTTDHMNKVPMDADRVSRILAEGSRELGR